MSGHSKWASIKHKKALVDAKRGKLFTKLIREIMVAARTGGGDPESNPRLRTAINTAKSANMPSDNIDRAVKKGTGGLEGVNYEEVHYEGYGPYGIAIYVHCLTDNKNRTASEIRNIFSKRQGALGGAGSVAWIFEKKGLVVVPAAEATEDRLMEVALQAGAEDLSAVNDKFEIVTGPSSLEPVKAALEAAQIHAESVELTLIPKNQVSLTPEKARAVMSLVEALEDHDDVQNVYANFEIPDEMMKELM
ncbi:MAG: YebC/PmpR family DNA-binding transcriptional regulator [Candidatus Omnitrophica bacterium]|nr:YebC/PmpR family DNA-binding transcriptional regulator [Candidatus Omnitrophota bacterium]